MFVYGVNAKSYKGETIIVLHPTDVQFMSAATQVLADDLRSIGVKVELQQMDFAADPDED